MNISEKLKLSQQPIVLFHEGKFLKVYNQSFYIIKQQLCFDLKVVVKYIASIDQVVIYGGFPVESIFVRLPQAEKTPFGYQLIAPSWNLTGYHKWFEENYQQWLLAEQKTMIKSLTAEQLLFLSVWQKNKYPSSVDSAFIQNLKDYFKV